MTLGKRLVKIRFPARAYQLRQVRCITRNAALKQGFSCEEIDNIVLAVNEACMNIIQHAYGEHDSGEIILEIIKNPNEILFRLIDFAAPINKTVIKSRNLEDIRPGGLGVHLITKVMDEVTFPDPPPGAGNVIEMKKFFNSSNHH